MVTEGERRFMTDWRNKEEEKSPKPTRRRGPPNSPFTNVTE